MKSSISDHAMGMFNMGMGVDILVRISYCNYVAGCAGFLKWYPNSWIVYNGKSYENW